MTATDAIRICRLMKPRTLIPIHYEGWGHFQEHRDAVEAGFALQPPEVRRSVRWLDIGQRTAIAC
jgi:L-ascorbate metabolism protein UlaG (beta-lactamase superfamily)